MKIASILFLIHSNVWAEQKLGPHKGFLQESGSYYLEVLMQKNGNVQVYLLDREMNNPTVKSSEVGVFIKSGQVESELSCHAQDELFFECKQSGKVFHKGELAISSKREGIRSEEVKIKIPFEVKN